MRAGSTRPGLVLLTVAVGQFLAVGSASIVSVALPTMTATAVGAVRPARAGMASAVHNALRQVGQALGVAVLGALVFAQLGGAAASGARLDPAGGEAFVRGLHHATVVSAALLAVGLVLALVLVPKAGGQAP